MKRVMRNGFTPHFTTFLSFSQVLAELRSIAGIVSRSLTYFIKYVIKTDRFVTKSQRKDLKT